MKKIETRILTLNFSEIELSKLLEARTLIEEILNYMDEYQLEQIENNEHSFTMQELEIISRTIGDITMYNSLGARIEEVEEEEYEA